MMTPEEKGKKGFAVISAKYGTARAIWIVRNAKSLRKSAREGTILSTAKVRDNMYSRENLRKQAATYFGVDIGPIDL